jgi:hypothetical protein
MTKRKIRDPNYQTRLSRKMSGLGFQMWGARSSKADAVKEASRLRKDGKYFVRVVRVSRAKGYPWPWAIYHKRIGGW